MEDSKTLKEQYQEGYIELDALNTAYVNAKIPNSQDHFESSGRIQAGDSRWRWFRDLLCGYRDEKGEMFVI